MYSFWRELFLQLIEILKRTLLFLAFYDSYMIKLKVYKVNRWVIYVYCHTTSRENDLLLKGLLFELSA